MYNSSREFKNVLFLFIVSIIVFVIISQIPFKEIVDKKVGELNIGVIEQLSDEDKELYNKGVNFFGE